MAFQLGGDAKLLTCCHHEVTGPPLKSFLFDVDRPAESADLDDSAVAAYALHTTRAVQHAVACFPRT